VGFVPGQLSVENLLDSTSFVTKGAAVTLSRTKPSRPRRVRLDPGDMVTQRSIGGHLEKLINICCLALAFVLTVLHHTCALSDN